MITYTKFLPSMVNTYFTSYIDTINNLIPSGEQTPGDMKNNLQKMLDQGTAIFVAIDNKTNEIIGTITVLIEQKLTRGGSKAAHIEELITRKGREGKGIASELIKKGLLFAKEQGTYKVILDCDKSLVLFYSKFGFKQSELMMRQYL